MILWLCEAGRAVGFELYPGVTLKQTSILCMYPRALPHGAQMKLIAAARRVGSAFVSQTLQAAIASVNGVTVVTHVGAWCGTCIVFNSCLLRPRKRKYINGFQTLNRLLCWIDLNQQHQRSTQGPALVLGFAIQAALGNWASFWRSWVTVS